MLVIIRWTFIPNFWTTRISFFIRFKNLAKTHSKTKELMCPCSYLMSSVSVLKCFPWQIFRRYSSTWLRHFLLYSCISSTINCVANCFLILVLLTLFLSEILVPNRNLSCYACVLFSSSVSTHGSLPHCRDGFAMTSRILNFISFLMLFPKYS
jgi:hypothetical protein